LQSISLKEKLQDRYSGIPEEVYDVPDYIPDDIPSDNIPEADEMDHEANDKYISARVWLPNPEGVAMAAKVMGRKRDQDGQLIGRSNKNPVLDTSLYDVEFDDGRVGTYSANIIAENIFEQVDTEGKVHVLLMT
jgi:hypothetical protein